MQLWNSRKFTSVHLCISNLINVEECTKKFDWMGLFLHKGIILITFDDYFDDEIISAYGHSSYNFRQLSPSFKPIWFVCEQGTGNQTYILVKCSTLNSFFYRITI